MVTKWLKYFRIIPAIFLVARVLDPSMKLDLTYQLINIYYQGLAQLDFVGYNELSLCTPEALNLPDPEVVKTSLNGRLHTLFNQYCQMYPHLVQSRHSSRTTTSTISNSLLAKILSVTQSGIGSSSQQTELDQYLSP